MWLWSPTPAMLMTRRGKILAKRPPPSQGKTNQHELGLLMCMTYVFKDGKYNGSILSVLGHNTVFHNHRELSIVWVSVFFHLARGVAMAKTYSFNTTIGDAVVENILSPPFHIITIREMGKQTQALLLCLMFIHVALVSSSGIAEEPEAVESWLKNLHHHKEKVTKLHFYFHDTPSAKNPTTIIVAKANTTLTSPTLFGMVSVIDDPLTIGPEPTSKIVGRAQGLFSAADQHELGLLMCMTYVFTGGKYNGSTLSVLGHNPVFHNHRELSIVGGSGVFRLARGVAMAKTYSFNTTTGDAVVEYDVVVVHY
ncbi:hypothetical protein M9H77_33875 [Catharanthus roseus]|uniref:Uncharacterized protein n=1 Tax=Catharanthus roseus TaxID=4058 RepID=A0ACB9ZJW3_CATRO|nr:hypothetical protein M9H77_33875 [Catharanthus roseus]